MELSHHPEVWRPQSSLPAAAGSPAFKGLSPLLLGQQYPVIPCCPILFPVTAESRSPLLVLQLCFHEDLEWQMMLHINHCHNTVC